MILLAVLGAIVVGGFFLFLKIRDEKKKQKLARQLRQSLQNIVHALRVGTGFMQALEYAAQDGDEPLRGQWLKFLQSVRMGQSIAESLDLLARRVPIKEMAWFVSAVQITQSTGGSLADVLDTLAQTLQEQQTLREKVAALTAQGKASGMLLSALPFVMSGVLYLVMPEMITPMFVTWPGQLMLAGALVSISIGGAVINRIVAVKVD